MNTGKQKIWRTFLYLVLFMVAVIYVYPIYFAITTALKTNIDALAMPPKFFVFRPTLQNVKIAFSDYDLLPALKNSLIISFSNTLLSLMVGTPCAFALSRTAFKGKKLISFWILSSRMIPPIVMVIPFFIIARQTGLYDTHIFLIFIYLTINLSFVVWMMKSFFDDIPVDLDEAALIDGCSDLKAFTKIILPLSSPGLVATAIFCLMFTWNEFLYALALTEFNAATLPIAISRFIGYTGMHWAEMCSAAVTTMIPILVAAAAVQKYIVKGLTVGAIK